MAYDSLWFFLILLLFPLFCILPHLIGKHKRKSSMAGKKYPESKFGTISNDVNSKNIQNSLGSKSQDMIVLGKMIKGVNTFSELQKITKLDRNELMSTLDDLTKRDLVRTKQKNGFFGSTIELVVTDKGYNVYHS